MSTFGLAHIERITIQHQKWEENQRERKTMIIMWGLMIVLSLTLRFVLIVMKIRIFISWWNLGVNFWELANVLLELHESKGVSRVACEFVACHLGKLLKLLNLHQSTELNDLARRYEIDITPELKDFINP